METKPEIPCPLCGQGNRADRRFCTECGSRLGRACPACGSSVEAGEKFCGSCGAALSGRGRGSRPAPSATSPPTHLVEKILASRSALQGERKQVTVLFADVQGSMDLAEQVDPEVFHHVMERFATLLAEGVHRFEGTVTHYTGDGVMALFGAPIALEDHAQRACYAALHLSDALRRYANELRLTRSLNFAVRMGLNSGEVVVGTIGDDLRMDYTAQGHTVGLAARMEQLAEPGKIYLTEHTAKLITGLLQLEDLGSLAVKGVQAPVGVFVLVGVGPLRTRLEVSRARGFSRFVGRDADLHALEAALARAQAGNGQVVGVVAEAGVGKSRLCFEFLARCRARGLRVYEAHGVAHGRNIPFLPMQALFRAYLGITEQDGERDARQKIAGRLILLADDFRDALPLVCDFLGVPDPERPVARMDPEARERQLRAIATRIVQADDRQGSTVTLLEDLHWFDRSSDALLETLVAAQARARGLLLLNFRPEFRARWMAAPHYEQRSLVPLGPEASAALMADLLGGSASLAGLAARLHERTGGNPFFIEEAVRGLVEAGILMGSEGAYRLLRPVEQVSVPPTVQAVLAARIDRLGERGKEVLQTAAVIGRQFSEPVLARVIELPAPALAAALQKLAAAEFVYEVALFPHAEYAFKHPLTQEVAYRSQLAERRARVHAAAARALAELHPDQLDEHAALLAYHWEAAGEALEAARWYRRAAEWIGTKNSAEAARKWEQVRTLAAKVPDLAEADVLGLVARAQLLNLGSRLGASAEVAAAVFEEGRALANRTGDLKSLAMLLCGYSQVKDMQGEPDQALRHAMEALGLAEQTGDRGLKLVVHQALAASHAESGRLREALRFAEQGLDLAPEDPRLGANLVGYSPYAWLTGFKARLLVHMGRLEEARRTIDRCLDLSRALGETEAPGSWYPVAALAAEHAGDAEGALAHARRAVEIAEKTGHSFSRAVAYLALGMALKMRGQSSEAVETLEHALAVSRERRTGLQFEAWGLSLLAEAQLANGEPDRARATANEAVAAAHQTPLFECVARLALARVLLRTDGAGARDAVHAALTRAEVLVDETGANAYAPLIHLERAELARLIGDGPARERQLREAQRLFVEMGATARAQQLARDVA